MSAQKLGQREPFSTKFKLHIGESIFLCFSIFLQLYCIVVSHDLVNYNLLGKSMHAIGLLSAIDVFSRK